MIISFKINSTTAVKKAVKWLDSMYFRGEKAALSAEKSLSQAASVSNAVTGPELALTPAHRL